MAGNWRHLWHRLNLVARFRRLITLLVILWLLTSVAILWTVIRQKGIPLPVFFSLYLAMTLVGSVVAVVLFGIDKRRATRNQPRISEKTLQLVSLAGGWPGAYLAQKFFRHKTQKVSFQLLFLLTLFVHGTFLLYSLWSGWFWLCVQILSKNVFSSSAT